MFDHVVAAVVICYCLCSFEYRVVRINICTSENILYGIPSAFQTRCKVGEKWGGAGC